MGDFIAPESLWSILKHFLSTNKQIYPSSYITVVNICLWKGTFTLQLLHETWGNISLYLRSCVALEALYTYIFVYIYIYIYIYIYTWLLKIIRKI